MSKPHQIHQNAELVNIVTAAEILGTTPISVRHGVRLGVLFGQPFNIGLKLGRSIRFKRSDIIKWIEDLK